MKQWLVIENELEFREATSRLEEIYHVERGSPDYREMLLLSLLVNKYEEQHYQIPDFDPIEVIKSRMKELGYTASDLAKKYGDKGTVSKVLNYKQGLSLTMIRKFTEMLQLSPEILMKEYELRRPPTPSTR